MKSVSIIFPELRGEEKRKRKRKSSRRKDILAIQNWNAIIIDPDYNEYYKYYWLFYHETCYLFFHLINTIMKNIITLHFINKFIY